jgi:hypothetical protein
VITLAGSVQAVATQSTQVTLLFTVSSIAYRILVIAANIRDVAASVSSMSFAGLALTRLGMVAGTNARSEMWYLLAPPVGTNNLVVNLNASTDTVIGGRGFGGVDQVSPFGSFFSATGTGTLASVAVSSSGDLVDDELYLATVAVQNNAQGNVTIAVSDGQIEGWNVNAGTLVNGTIGGGSRKAGAASTVVGWSISSSQQWAIAAAPLKPFRERLSDSTVVASQAAIGSAAWQYLLEERVRRLESGMRVLRGGRGA